MILLYTNKKLSCRWQTARRISANAMAWFTTTCPSPYMLPCRIWSFCIKGCRHKFRKTLKIWARWNPHCVILPNFVVLGQTVQASLRRFAWKFWPLMSRLSRSLKVIGTDTNRSTTYDFLLTFYSNHARICLSSFSR